MRFCTCKDLLEDKSVTDIRVEGDVFVADAFLDEIVSEVDKLEVTNAKVCEVGDNNIFSFESNSFLGTKCDWVGEAEEWLSSALDGLGVCRNTEFTAGFLSDKGSIIELLLVLLASKLLSLFFSENSSWY